MTLDDIRRNLPQFGFAIFAMDPAEPVSFEVYSPEGTTYTWTGDTVQEAIDKAFPPAPAVPAPVSFFD